MRTVVLKRNPRPEPLPIIIPTGPTLSPDYNLAYAIWTHLPGCGTAVECEECGCDLTGKEVHQRHMWLCTPCKDQHDAHPPTQLTTEELEAAPNEDYPGAEGE